MSWLRRLLARLLRRRVPAGPGRPDGPAPPGAGVREPRRPSSSPPAMAAAREENDE